MSHVSANYTMRLDPEAIIECRIQDGAGGKPFPYLDLGYCFTILPSLAQLEKIRDAITACLESPEAKTLLEAEAAKVPIAPRPVKRSGPEPARPTPDVDLMPRIMRSGGMPCGDHTPNCAIWIKQPCDCGIRPGGRR